MSSDIRVAALEQKFQDILQQQKNEEDMWKSWEVAMTEARGTAIPALYSVFYKFIQNPSTVSVDTMKRMIDTDETIGSGIDFVTTSLAARLGKYEHPSEEITQWVNEALSHIDGGWFNNVKEMLSACWASFFVGEKVWKNDPDLGFIVDRIVTLPPTSILFEVDQEGRIEPDGILQYQRNVNPFGMTQNFNFFGGVFAGGFSIGAGVPFNELKTDPFAKMGDMPYPIRNSNSFLYLTVRIPKEKCIHYAFNSQGKMGNPYGRSLLRRAFNAYVSKASTVQMMLRALDRKGTPLMIGYAAPNTTVKDPTKVRSGVNAKGMDVGEDAGKSLANAFRNVHVDTFIALPGKKGTVYEVDSIPMDPNTDQFITAIKYFDSAMLRAMLIPSLIFSSGDGTGSYALGDAHSKTYDRICDGHLEGLKQVLREQLILQMLKYNFPESAWKNDGIGDFSKRELSPEEKEKEGEKIEKALELGVADLEELDDYNVCREALGFEPRDAVPEKVKIMAQVKQDLLETGGDQGDDDGGNESDSGE